MKADIISIGNSKGIRIPSTIIKQCKIGEHVELEVEEGKIILKPLVEKPREGWEKAFRLMHERNEDTLLIDECIDFSEEYWEWK